MKLQLIACFLAVVGLIKADNVQQLCAASSAFSQRLHQAIASNLPNAIFSPYSIHSALSMTSLGARGETATQMSQTLGLTSLTDQSAHLAYHDLIQRLNSATSVKLNTANAIYANPNVPIEAQFVKDVKDDYFALSTNFDLAAPGGPEKAVNDFVDKNTNGVIKDALPKGFIQASTVMVLVNTIFFNGTWMEQFVEGKTQKKEFTQLGGTKTQVDTMYDERAVNIKNNVHGADVAELPFKGNRFSLYIALPQKADGITEFEKSLTTPGVVDTLFEGLTPVRVRLSVPKFKIESKFNLKSQLQKMGMVNAFNAATANFQGISSAGAYINEVIHKAVIEVKETGTVAAAVTAIGLHPLVVIQPPVLEFKADHPFVFFLRDNQNDAILFQGKFSG